MQADYTPSRSDLRPADAGPPGAPPDAPPARPMTFARGAIILGGACVLAGLCLPIDLAAARFCTRFGDTGDLRLGGDLRRTLMYLQQFGDIAWSVLIGITIMLLDPGMTRRFADWILGAGLTWVAVWGVKVLAGRPRPGVVLSPDAMPGYDSALRFVGAWSRYPLPRTAANGPTLVWAHSWELSKGIAADLWSMPSSHSSAAAALAVVLSRLYPRLTPLVVALTLITACARVVFVAHYPSDTIVGLALGYVITAAVMDHRWGSRAVGRRTPWR